MTENTPGIIAAGHRQTVAAGQAILKEGGNAFDAAVAAILASFVVEPTLTSTGGGGFLLAHTSDNCNTLFDFFTQTPYRKRDLEEVNFYPVKLNFGGATQVFHIGLGSMAVPGTLAGAFEVHRQLGRLPLSVVIEPAIHYASKGVKISNFQGFCLQLLQPILETLPEVRKIYAPNGKLLETGDYLYFPDFATTLAHIAQEGIEEFYQGEIARQLVKDCQEQGGYLTQQDLDDYSVIQRTPLKFSYRDWEILTNPPPSSGGTLIACALKLLEQLNLEGLEFGSSEHLQILSEVMRLTNEARKDSYDARIYEADIAKDFLSLDHLRPYQQQLREGVNKWGSTTHISVVDREGNAASVTTSNGEGSSYMIPGTGIMMNNMLGEADLNPLGFHQWQVNQRISSMMSPTIVLRNGKPELVLGSGGSNRIRTAILQVIINLLDFQMSVEEAVSSPRVHWENGLFNLEPGFSQDAISKISSPFTKELVVWQEKNMFFGGVNAVRIAPNGVMEGAGDMRREGAVE